MSELTLRSLTFYTTGRCIVIGADSYANFGSSVPVSDPKADEYGLCLEVHAAVVNAG